VWREAGIEWEDYGDFYRRTQKMRGTTKKPEGYKNVPDRGSSWQSLMRSTHNIEAEHLNGDIVKLGHILGIKTPYNELLWRKAKEMINDDNKPGKYTVEELNKMIENETYSHIELNS